MPAVEDAIAVRHTRSINGRPSRDNAARSDNDERNDSVTFLVVGTKERGENAHEGSTTSRHRAARDRVEGQERRQRGCIFPPPRGPGRVVEFCAANSILCSAESGAS